MPKIMVQIPFVFQAVPRDCFGKRYPWRESLELVAVLFGVQNPDFEILVSFRNRDRRSGFKTGGK